MPIVYSDLLGGSILCSLGTTTLGTPPLGYKWIIRDISVILPELVVPHSWPGWMIEDTPHNPIFARYFPNCIGGTLYEWHGAQVLDVPNFLTFVSYGNTWRCRVSGYQLTLP